MSTMAAYDMAAEQWPDTLVPHRVTVEEFGRMGEAHVFDPEARLELIDGEIVEMAPIYPAHAYAVNRLSRLLHRHLDEMAVVATQNPVGCGEWFQPQPDIAVAKEPDEQYLDRHPEPDDLFVVIEVADSTVRSDRNEKVPRYARSGIREAWLVDIPGGALEVYTNPEDGRYRRVDTFRPGGVVRLTAFPEIELEVGYFLPPQPSRKDDS